MDRKVPKYQYHFKKRLGATERSRSTQPAKGLIVKPVALEKKGQPLRDITNTKLSKASRSRLLQKAGPYNSFMISDLDLSPIAPLSNPSPRMHQWSASKLHGHVMDALPSGEALSKPIKIPPFIERIPASLDRKETSVCSGEHFVNPMEWLTEADELALGTSSPSSWSSEPPPLLSSEPCPLVPSDEPQSMALTQAQLQSPLLSESSAFSLAQTQVDPISTPDRTPLLSTLTLKRINGSRRPFKFWVRAERYQLPRSATDSQDLVF